MANKKVGDIAGDLIMGAVVLVGGYFLFTKLFGGGSGTTANNNLTTANTTATAAGDIATAKASGGKQTVNDTTLNTLANTLQQQIANQDDPSNIVNNVVQVNTLVDWLRLVQLFGTRSFNTGSWYSACNLTGYNCDALDLGSALRAALPADYIANINSYFSDQGINASI